MPLNSDGQAFWTDLAVDPTYDEELSPAVRQFQWTFNLPIHHQVAGAVPLLSGDYQLRVELPQGDGTWVSVTSAVFSVVAD